MFERVRTNTRTRFYIVIAQLQLRDNNVDLTRGIIDSRSPDRAEILRRVNEPRDKTVDLKSH